MRGGAQNIFGKAAFHDAALVHDNDLLGHIGNHAQIMGDKDHAHAGVFLQAADQPQDLRLRGHVKRCGRFIRDQQFWLGDHGHGDHRALAHPAGHFERIAAPRPHRIGEPHLFELFQHAALGLGPAHVAMQPQDFGHLIAQTVQGRQGPHRFLENHRNPVASDGAHCLFRQRHQLGRSG